MEFHLCLSLLELLPVLCMYYFVMYIHVHYHTLKQALTSVLLELGHFPYCQENEC